MKTVGIIGTGKLGTSLGRALHRYGIPITAISDSSPEAARESLSLLDDADTVIAPVQAAVGMADLIILTVPDDSLTAVVDQLRNARIRWEEKTVFHCSGLHGAALLDPLREQGARTASVHPIQSFAEKDGGPESFRGITFGIEGDANALDQARFLIEMLGGRVLVLDPKQKPLYHAACSIASNLFVSLIGLAVELLKETGMESASAFTALTPLIRGTLKNMMDSGPKASLTGPLKRGDIDSVASHLNALEKDPDASAVYRRLSRLALEWIRLEKILTPEKTEVLENLLKEK